MSAYIKSLIVGVEVAGYDEAIISRAGYPSSLFDWATSQSVRIARGLTPQSFSAHIKNRDLSAGGVKIDLTGVPYSWLNVRPTNTCTVTQTVEAADTTVYVDSTAGFAASGRIYIGRECILYAGTTATSFTGCDRTNLNLKLGTSAQQHVVGSQVVDIPYSILDRRCRVYWWDEEHAAVEMAASGWVTGLDFTGTGYVLRLEGIGSRMRKKLIFANGTGSGVVVGGYTRSGVDTHTIDGHNQILLSSTNMHLGGAFNALKVDDEIVVYRKWEQFSPNALVLETNVATAFRGAGFVVDYDTKLVRGLQVKFTDVTTGQVVHTLIESVGFSVTHPTTGKLVQISDGTYYPTVGSTIETENMWMITGITRGFAGTAYHQISGGMKFTEAIAKEGSFVSIVLSLLLSGGSSTAKYNALGGIGAGFSDADVDWQSIEWLPTFFTSLVISEPVAPIEYLATLAVLVGGYINPLAAGGMTITVPNIYPGADHPTLGINDIIGAPNWSVDTSDITNITEVQAPKGALYINDAGSVARFGSRVRTFAKLENVPQLPTELLAHLWLDNLESKDPRIRLSVVVRRDYLDTIGVGDVITVTLPTIPDMGDYYIHEVVKNFVLVGVSGVSETSVRLDMITIKSRSGIGYVAPSARVKSVSGSNVVVELNEFSSSTIVPNPDVPVYSAGEHDSYWFIVGDYVDLVDWTTVGTGTITRVQTLINSINYSTHTLELDSVPSWVAPGTIITLADYTATAGGPNSAKREPYFVRTGYVSGVPNKKYGV